MKTTHAMSLALSILSATTLGVGCAASGEEPTNDAREAILNGDAATDTAVLGINDNEHGNICSGTLIASQWVLTAAHCVTDAYGQPSSAENLWIPGGGAVDNIVVHPSYFGGGWVNGQPSPYQTDVALLHLASPIFDDYNVNWRGETCTLASTPDSEQGCLLTRIANFSPATLDGQILRCESIGPTDPSLSPSSVNSAEYVISAANVQGPWYVFSPNEKGQIHIAGDSGSACFAPMAAGEVRGTLLTVTSVGTMDYSSSRGTTSDQFYDWAMTVIPAAQRVQVCGGTVVDSATVCNTHCGTITDACGDVHQCAPCPPPPTPMSWCGDDTVNAGVQVPVDKEYCCDRDEGSPFLCCAFRTKYAGMCRKLGL